MDGRSISNSKDKANVLNNYFKSVFTRENLSTLSTISNAPRHISDMPNLTISQQGIQNLLSMLDVQEASGPDLISPYIKHCAN